MCTRHTKFLLRLALLQKKKFATETDRFKYTNRSARRKHRNTAKLRHLRLWQVNKICVSVLRRVVNTVRGDLIEKCKFGNARYEKWTQTAKSIRIERRCGSLYNTCPSGSEILHRRTRVCHNRTNLSNVEHRNTTGCMDGGLIHIRVQIILDLCMYRLIYVQT